MLIIGIFSSAFHFKILYLMRSSFTFRFFSFISSLLLLLAFDAPLYLYPFINTILVADFDIATSTNVVDFSFSTRAACHLFHFNFYSPFYIILYLFVVVVAVGGGFFSRFYFHRTIHTQNKFMQMDKMEIGYV